MEVAWVGKLKNIGTQQAEKEKKRATLSIFVFIFFPHKKIVRSIEIFWTMKLII